MSETKKIATPRRLPRKKPSAQEARVSRIARLARKALKGFDVPPP